MCSRRRCCAEVARKAAAQIELDGLDREGSGEAVMLWRTDGSEAWLNTWWQPRDSGFHDHDGSCGGVHVLAGAVTGEYLRVAGAREVTRFEAGESFSFRGDAIHRVDHLEGAVTVHVYSPPLRSIGHYELVERRAAAGAGHTRGDLATEPRADAGPRRGLVQQS